MVVAVATAGSMAGCAATHIADHAINMIDALYKSHGIPSGAPQPGA
jgi:hypothetical protein